VKTELNPQHTDKQHSLAELKHRIALGEYAVDPGVLAGEILWKTDLIRRVRHDLSAEGEGRRPRRRRSRRFAPGGLSPLRARKNPRG
jgi:hypothetical protein